MHIPDNKRIINKNNIKNKLCLNNFYQQLRLKAPDEIRNGIYIYSILELQF